MYWLLKTEPSVFSFEDLVKSPNKTTCWEGVRNYQARNFLRDGFQKGDLVFIYHSNVEEPAIMGIATVVRTAYPDPFAVDRKSKYFDERVKPRDKNPWVVVDVQASERFANPVTREQMMAQASLKGMALLKRGNRLSVLPITKDQYQTLCKLGKPTAL